MKKLVPLLISSVLVVGAVGCQSDTSKTSDAGTTNEAPLNAAKEAASKTETAAKGAADSAKTAVTGAATKATTAVKGAADGAKTSVTNATAGSKTIIKNQLEKKFPGSSLNVEEKDGVVTIKGTVPDEATLKKIEPAVKEYKFEGIKTVKVEAKVAEKKAQ